MNIFGNIRTWWGGLTSFGETVGAQQRGPGAALVEGTSRVGADAAMQISTVWACIDRRATTLASLPFFVYEQKPGSAGQKQLARMSRLYTILHDSPNSRMTPFEFWRAMVMYHDLRGVAYARIERDDNGEAVALWPMPTDQVEARVLDDGSMVYIYRFANDVAVLSEENVYVLKNLGNGTTSFDKLEFMRAGLDEAAKAQSDASRLFGAAGKPSGVLMIDKVLNKEQKAAVKRNFGEMGEGSTSRLHLLEADMKYQQITLTPEQQQLLATRMFGVEELCRWFDVPPVLVHHSNVTAWGSGIEQLVAGFYTLAMRPLLINIEQGVRKRVMTSRQRVTLVAEFNLDALLRGSLKDRMEIYAKAVQNGIKSRNECRQLENDEPYAGGEIYTAQSNLAPVAMLGDPKLQRAGAANSPIAQ
ncbi:phage portal protein [Massilia sp. DD77]|uniref:phage portal protein n=1 Tax=Massilia sp. DD77 TaxID=3109349 RepID=UPI002FFD742A